MKEITFRLYNHATESQPENLVWDSGPVSVEVKRGVFSVILGDTTLPSTQPALDPDIFNGQLWLSVEVENDGEMVERQKIAGAPFAIRAATVESIPNDMVTGDMIVDGSITLSDIGGICADGETLLKTASGWICSPAHSACVSGQDFINCYSGAQETMNVGICKSGVRRCVQGSFSGICEGEIIPQADEECDGLDNDCNGSIDDGLVGPLNSNQEGVCLGSVQTCSGVGGWVDNYSGPNYQAVETLCDGLDNDCDGTPDEGCAGGSAASALIQAARDSVDGSGLNLPINGAIVTYTKPLIGNDAAGFFIQAEQGGPALYIAVDPATLVPVPSPGDIVNFSITAMATIGTLRQATAIAGYSRSDSGYSVSELVQDVSAAADLVFDLNLYESELIALNGTVAAEFAAAGTGFVSAQINTTTISGDSNLKLRISNALSGSLGLIPGCTFTLPGTPLWRNNLQAQPSAWAEGDINVTSCPAPAVVGASASSTTSVLVTFDRDIDPASVLADGSQFTFTGGLTAYSVVVTGNTVVVNLSPETVPQLYTVTVAGTVTDILGTGIDSNSNSADFFGWDPIPAGSLVINEVDYDNISTDTHEFIELYNPTASDVNLANVAVVLVNGSNGVEYSRINLSSAGSLAPDAYLLIGSAAVAGVDFILPDSTVQNGSPDGIAVIDTSSETVIDALSYEGSITAATITGFTDAVNLVEGSDAYIEDSAVSDGSISRCPNGSDTDDLVTDWSFTPIGTPGSANSCQ